MKTNETLFILDHESEHSELEAAKAKLTQEKENFENIIRGERRTILERIIAQRKQAVANLTYTEKKLNRFQKLYHAKAIAKDELDQVSQTIMLKNNWSNHLKQIWLKQNWDNENTLSFSQQAAVDAASANMAKLAGTGTKNSNRSLRRRNF